MAANTYSAIQSIPQSQLIFSYKKTEKKQIDPNKGSYTLDLSKPPLRISISPTIDGGLNKPKNLWISPHIVSLVVMIFMTLGIPSFLWGYAASPITEVVPLVQASEPERTAMPVAEESNPFANMVTITVEPTSIPVPTPQLESPSIEQQARSIAREFNINEDVFVCTLRKESGLHSTWPNGMLKCGDGGRSCGIAQIQLGTWKSIRKHAGWSQDDLRANDVESMRTAAYGISTLWPYHWTGYRLCTS